jgi:molybdopterin-guanine dinucleotide biosynthesis protein A
MYHKEISAFIIAGGKSSRFGEDKALFIYRGMPLIALVAKVVGSVLGPPSIIADEGERFGFLGLPCYGDLLHGTGPFGGVYSALAYAATERAFVFACDMPELDPGLIRFMAGESKGFDVTVPLVNGNYEPLHAVYAKSCLGLMEMRIKQGQRRIVGFYGEVSARTVSEDEIRRFADPSRVFRNINYPHEAPDA